MLLDQISFVSSLFHIFSHTKKKNLFMCVLAYFFKCSEENGRALGLGLDQQVWRGLWAQTPADLGSGKHVAGSGGTGVSLQGPPIPGPLGVWSDVGA